MSQVQGVWDQRNAHLDANAWGECCRQCCCYTCCCKKMSRTLRMKLLFVTLHLIGLISGIVIGVYYSGPIENELSPMDMKYVNQHLLPLFCEGLTVDSKYDDIDMPSTEKFSAYLMDRRPNIEINRRVPYNASKIEYVNTNGYSYQRFYFLEKSSVRLSGSTDILVSVGIVKGFKNFQNLEENNFICSDCFLRSYTFFPSQTFDVNFEIADSDDYFFVLISLVGEGFITLNYQMHRTIFDTDNYIDACVNETKCHLSFPYIFGKVGVVIQRGNSDDFSDVNLEVTCLLRTWMLLVIFFISPLLLSLLGSCCIFVCCQESSDSTTYPSPRIIDPSIQRSREPLLDGSFQPNYGTLVLPPNYDDIVKSTDDTLPSYEEAMSSGQS